MLGAIGFELLQRREAVGLDPRAKRIDDATVGLSPYVLIGPQPTRRALDQLNKLARRVDVPVSRAIHTVVERRRIGDRERMGGLGDKMIEPGEGQSAGNVLSETTAGRDDLVAGPNTPRSVGHRVDVAWPRVDDRPAPKSRVGKRFIRVAHVFTGGSEGASTASDDRVRSRPGEPGARRSISIRTRRPYNSLPWVGSRLQASRAIIPFPSIMAEGAGAKSMS